MITINLDFDGTCVTHDFPKTGKDIGSIPVLKELVNKGHKLILFTMRSKIHLENAVKWFEENDIPLYGIQENPSQWRWTSSPKSYADMMIDDSALGCPLKIDKTLSDRPFVDWEKVRELLIENNIL